MTDNVYDFNKYKKAILAKREEQESNSNIGYRFNFDHPEVDGERYECIVRDVPDLLSEEEIEKIIFSQIKENTKQDVFLTEEELQEIVDWASDTIEQYALVCGLINGDLFLSYNEQGGTEFVAIDDPIDDGA